MPDLSTRTTKKSSKKFVIAVLAVCLAGAGAWWWSQNSTEKTERGPRMGGSFMGAVPVNAQQVRLIL